MDVRATFLNEDLVEDVYMSQPIGFEEVDRNTWFVNSKNQFVV